MLNPILALLTVGLLSIHQYIPTKNTDYIQYFDDVREAQASNIFPAANQSCLYLSSIFISAGLEKTTGGLADSPFGDFLKQSLGDTESIHSFMNILYSPEYASKLQKYGLEPEAAIDFLKKICKKDFSPLDFSYLERQSVLDLIESEIHILSEKELNSLGSFAYFGTIPVFDRKGELLTALNPKYRKWISYHELPKSLILAILAAEDRRFFVHRGSDEIAISRIAKQMLGSQRATGGSTLTMQLLKNMHFEARSSQVSFFQEGQGALLLRKVREWYWAKPFESHFKKEGLSHKKQILESYFNLVYLGNNIQGIEQASQVYFSKPAREMSLAESAYAVTLLKGPNRYSDPLNYEGLTKGRRNDYVLERMGELCSEIHQSRFLTDKKEIQSLMKEICKKGGKKINRELIEEEKKTPLPLWDSPEFVETHESFIPIQRQVRSVFDKIDFSSPNHSKELTVKTTIDKNLQKILFEVMREYLDKYDLETESLSKIEPIKNSKGEKAEVIKEDIPYSLSYRLQSLISSLSQREVQWLYSVQLNPGSYSFDFKKAESFLKGFNLLNSTLIREALTKIQKELERKTGAVGSLLFVSLKKDGGFSIYSLNEALNRLSLSKDRINEIRSNLSTAQIQNFIYKRALARIYNDRQRDYLEPVLYLGADTVLNRSLEKALLPQAYQSLLYSYRSGDFFWAKKEGSFYKLKGEKLQASAFIMNSKTGELLARFDGYNPKNNYFYRASQAQRQPGSLLKPFTYLYALDRKDFHPQSILNNESVFIPIDNLQSYTPKNNSNKYKGSLFLSQAFVQSQNIAAVSLIQDERWGSLDWSDNLKELMSFYKSLDLYQDHSQTVYPSFLLGSEEESLSQVVSSFSLFANGAYITKPYFINEIKNYQGYDFYKPDIYVKIPDLIKPGSLFQIRSLLVQTANIGTAGRLYNFPYNLKEGRLRELCYNNLLKANSQSCFGGKTGTSDEEKDLWFVGFSQNFVIGIWMGYDIKRPTFWKSSSLVDVFSSLVERGLDYLPPIRPVLTPEDRPVYLEKREVFGNRACSNPIESEASYIIYTARDSERLECEMEEGVLEEEYGICECKKAKEIERDSNGVKVSERIGYTLDILYKGHLHENLDFWESLSECQRDKKKFIDKKTRVRLCQ